MHEYFYLLFIILFSQCIEVILGFGATFFSLLLFSLLGLEGHNIWVLIPLNILINIFIIGKDIKYVRPIPTLKHLLPGIIIGFLVAHFLAPYLDPKTFKVLCGVILFILLAIKFFKVYLFPRLQKYLHTFSSGIAYSSIGAGGPFLALYLSVFYQDKNQTRSNLAVIWLITNLMVLFYRREEMSLINFSFIELAGVILTLFISARLGQFLHTKINQAHYQNCTNIILLLTSFSLMVFS